MKEKINNLQDQTYAVIKDMILKVILKPGQKVSQKELVERTGFGETPVREAIIRLKRENLFNVLPQSGTFVSKIDLQELYEAKFVRENIESIIVMEASRQITDAQLEELKRKVKIQRIFLEAHDKEAFFKLDEEFHYFFYEIDNKINTWNWLNVFLSQLNRFRNLRLEITDFSWNSIAEQHEKIVQSIEEKDSNKLETLIHNHLNLIDDEFYQVYSTYPTYFTRTSLQVAEDQEKLARKAK